MAAPPLVHIVRYQPERALDVYGGYVHIFMSVCTWSDEPHTVIALEALVNKFETATSIKTPALPNWSLVNHAIDQCVLDM